MVLKCTCCSVRRADCVTDHYLVVAQVREGLALSKQSMHTVHMERFNSKKLNEVEGKEQYRVEISSRFADLEDLYPEVDSNNAWKLLERISKFLTERA
jgi:hypothetical protein